MPLVIPMQNYTPATKFKSQQAEWLRKVDDDNAVAVTRHGQAIAVVISPAQWERFLELELDHDHSCASTIITPELFREARTRARRGLTK